MAEIRYSRLLELITRIHRRLMGRLIPLLRSEGLSGGEMMVLWKVHQQGFCRVTELAGNVNIPPSTMTGILDRLVSRGWLERVPAPDDRRGTILRSTPPLGELIGRLSAGIEQEMREVFAAYPEEDCRQLQVNLEQVLRYLEERQR